MKKLISWFCVILSCVIFFSCQQVNEETITGATNQRTVSLSVSGDTGKPTICLVGDSRVAMTPATLFTDKWVVTNIGVAGSTSYYNAVLLSQLIQSYDTIIISVGINDYHNDISLTDSVNCLSCCCMWAKQHATHVYLTTIPGVCVSSTFDLTDASRYSCNAWQINAYIPIIAQNCGVTLIPLANMLNYGLYLRSDYADQSGIHYNTAGYQALRELYANYGI